MSSIDPITLARLTGQLPHVLEQAARDKVVETCNLITSLPKYSGRSILVPHLEFNVKGKTAGWAYGPTRIRLNSEAMLNHTEGMLSDTIPHEVAHCVCNQWWPNERVGHGPKWQILMLDIGLQPTRCHNYDKLTPGRRTKRHVYNCECPGRTFKLSTTKHNKYSRGTARYWCPTCQADLIYTGLQVEG